MAFVKVLLMVWLCQASGLPTRIEEQEIQGVESGNAGIMNRDVNVSEPVTWERQSESVESDEKSDRTLKSRSAGDISDRFINEVPVLIKIGKEELKFKKEGGDFVARHGDFEAIVTVEPLGTLPGKRWTTIIHNKGDEPLKHVTVLPLHQVFKLYDIVKDRPSVRYFTGSNYYDGKYPHMAFVEHEERFMWNSMCRPVVITSQSAWSYVPMMQFAVNSGEEKVGLTVILEWSANWTMRAALTHTTMDKPPSSTNFTIQSDWELGDLTLDPHEVLELPAIHMIYSNGTSWEPFTHDMHSYVLHEVAPNMTGAASSMPVSYDHWFGIGMDITADKLKPQVDKAAEIGCEYFVVDGGWSMDPWGGNTTVDPKKFPEGMGDFADYVRSKGMRFGIWNAMEYGKSMTSFDHPDIMDVHRRTLKKWRDEWDLQWMRLEGHDIPGGKEALKAQKAMKELYTGFLKENPEFYLEGCKGGGTRMDLNMVRMSHGTWLNDHTANADVCRFAQTGALRVWPARYLNQAVETYPGMGDQRAYGHYFLSRMPGLLSFDGDIAQWSANATALAKKHVEVFKQIRQYKEQKVFFPLRQPRSPDDWDAVVFGDGKGDAQLLFVFRMEGEDDQFMRIPEAPGKWEELLNNGDGKIESERNGWRVTLNMNSSALWWRKPEKA
jgi:hypothetical protein